MLKTAVIVCVIFVCVEGVTFPRYFTKCTKKASNQDKCLLDNANAGLPTYIKGDPSVHIVPLNPLHANEMFINVDGNLKINLTHCDINGLEKTVFEKFRWDWDNKKISFDARMPRVNLEGNYNISGRILILPIKGQGPCNITFVNPLFHLEFDYEIKERNGKEYFSVVGERLTYEVDRVYFILQRLFGGDPKLGQEMLKFLDENWKEVNEEIGIRVGDALGKLISAILNFFFARLPMSLLWD